MDDISHCTIVSTLSKCLVDGYNQQLQPENTIVSKSAIMHAMISVNKHKGSRLWGEEVGWCFRKTKWPSEYLRLYCFLHIL